MEPTLPTTTTAPPPPQADFDDFYRQHRARMVATVNAVTRAGADAATEAVDEAFVRALIQWERVRLMDAPAGWVFTVARNEVTRTRSRKAREDELAPGSHLGPQAAVEPQHEAKRVLWDAVAALPERQRLAVALRYLADLTEDQVASTMGIARGTVAATLHSARQTLAASLAEPAIGTRTTKDARHA